MTFMVDWALNIKNKPISHDAFFPQWVQKLHGDTLEGNFDFRGTSKHLMGMPGDGDGDKGSTTTTTKQD